jgi:xanthine dehydrogenase accessory factor
MTPEILAALEAAKRAGQPIVLGTRLPDGMQQLLPDPAASDAVNEAARAALADDETRTVKLGEHDWFLHVYNPPLRLIVVGAVHIAQALVAFASDERFPNVAVSTEWPDEAMEKLRPDVRTAVVTLTHDPKLDDPALDHALKSPCFYIGALGSRKTHAARLKRLRELGHNDLEMARIRGPVGLNIEAVTAPEIALSIIAEVVAAHRGSPLGQKAAA